MIYLVILQFIVIEKPNFPPNFILFILLSDLMMTDNLHLYYKNSLSYFRLMFNSSAFLG